MSPREGCIDTPVRMEEEESLRMDFLGRMWKGEREGISFTLRHGERRNQEKGVGEGE